MTKPIALCSLTIIILDRFIPSIYVKRYYILTKETNGKLVAGIGNSIMIDVPILYITLACSIDNTCVTVKAKCRRHCFIKESMDGMSNVFSVRENVSSVMAKGDSVEIEKTKKGNYIRSFMANPLS